jgi:hypothetical protein
MNGAIVLIRAAYNPDGLIGSPDAGGAVSE